jgi:hypothetical protein
MMRRTHTLSTTHTTHKTTPANQCTITEQALFFMAPHTPHHATHHSAEHSTAQTRSTEAAAPLDVNTISKTHTHAQLTQHPE